MSQASRHANSSTEVEMAPANSFEQESAFVASNGVDSEDHEESDED